MQNLEGLKDKVRNLNRSNFVPCSFDEMNNGDIVLSWTMTNSQKYLLKPGYEDYNKIKYGVLLEKNIEYPQSSILLEYDLCSDTFEETNFYVDPGTSGGYSLEKYIDKIL
jgi:hypothetical protein